MRWESTGHGEEVQGTVRKYRARWGSTGHGEKVQGTDGSTGHGGEVQGAVGISKFHFYLALLQKMQEEKMVFWLTNGRTLRNS